MSYSLLASEKIRARGLIDQLPNDQHKLTCYVEVGENYDKAQSNAQAFKTPNLTENIA